MRRLASFAQGQPAPFCLRDVRLCHRRAVRSRRHGYHQRPGTDAALKWHHNPFSPLVPPHAPRFQVFGAGLALGLWLYSGYEQLSSVAEEVEEPQKTYPRALAIVVPLSIATYFLPTLFSLAALG